MKRGGARPGAGRPKGGRNKRTADLNMEAAANGVNPVQFLLDVMRDETRDFAVRMDAAKAVAPYTNPRLASTEVKGDKDSPLIVKIVQFGEG